MSYDIDVYLTRPPIRAVLAAVAEAGGASLQVEAPSRVEAEDLPEALAGVKQRFMWVVQLHLEGSPNGAAIDAALELADQIATAHDGVVVDLQEEAAPSPAAGDGADVVRVAWFVSEERWLRDDTCAKTLAVLAATAPSALPRRYGTYEPFQGKFEGRDKESLFCQEWAAVAHHDSTGYLWWSGRRPCRHAFACSSTARQGIRPGNVPSGEIGIDLDFGSADPEAVVKLFTTMAAAHDCFFAAAFVPERREGPGRPPLRDLTILSQQGWGGLPSAKLWLVWLGEPYASTIEMQIASSAVRYEQGLMIRASGEQSNVFSLAEDTDIARELFVRRANDEDGALSAAQLIPTL
jgi:hypothetical protein